MHPMAVRELFLNDDPNTKAYFHDHDITADVKRLLVLKAKNLPCPICNGIESCDHCIPERERAALKETGAE